MGVMAVSTLEIRMAALHNDWFMAINLIGQVAFPT
jgi:hypothetical protein